MNNLPIVLGSLLALIFIVGVAALINLAHKQKAGDHTVNVWAPRGATCIFSLTTFEMNFVILSTVSYASLGPWVIEALFQNWKTNACVEVESRQSKAGVRWRCFGFRLSARQLSSISCHFRKELAASYHLSSTAYAVILLWIQDWMLICLGGCSYSFDSFIFSTTSRNDLVDIKIPASHAWTMDIAEPHGAVY